MEDRGFTPFTEKERAEVNALMREVEEFNGMTTINAVEAAAPVGYVSEVPRETKPLDDNQLWGIPPETDPMCDLCRLPESDPIHLSAHTFREASPIAPSGPASSRVSDPLAWISEALNQMRKADYSEESVKGMLVRAKDELVAAEDEAASLRESHAALVKAADKANKWFQHTTPKWNKDTQKAIEALEAELARAKELL